MVPRAGLEPARLSTEDFESTKSTISSPRRGANLMKNSVYRQCNLRSASASVAVNLKQSSPKCFFNSELSKVEGYLI